MKAYHNDPKVKKKYVARVRAHQKADEIVKGKYWEGGKGCAVGCTIHSGNHSSYETELGIPTWLAQLEDRIFEGLPNKRAMKWPLELLKAIKPGQDLEKIKIPFLIFVVESARENFDHKKYPKQLAAIDKVLTELRAPIINLENLRAARAAATAAAFAAAATDAYAYAAYAAYAANAAAASARAAASAATDAAAVAADRAAASACAIENEYVEFADELLRLIKGLK